MLPFARQHDVKPTIFGVEIGSKSFQAGRKVGGRGIGSKGGVQGPQWDSDWCGGRGGGGGGVDGVAGGAGGGGGGGGSRPRSRNTNCCTTCSNNHGDVAPIATAKDLPNMRMREEAFTSLPVACPMAVSHSVHVFSCMQTSA